MLTKSVSLLSCACIVLSGQAHLVAASCIYEELVLRQNPAAYYRFEETVPPGKLLENSTDYLQDAIYYPDHCSRLEKGAILADAAAMFNGQGRKIWSPNLEQSMDDIFLPKTAFSAELWAKFGGKQGKNYSPMGRFSRTTSGTRGWYIWVNEAGHWCFSIGGGNSSNTTTIVGGKAEDRWEHLVVTYNGTRMSMYKDGVLMGSQTFYDASGECLGGAGMSFGVGCCGDAGISWVGGLDECAFYKSVLSAETVAKHYDLREKSAEYAQAVRKLDPVVYWRMNELEPPNEAHNSGTGDAGYYGFGAISAPGQFVCNGIPAQSNNRSLCLTNYLDFVQWQQSTANTQSWSFSGWLYLPEPPFDYINRYGEPLYMPLLTFSPAAASDTGWGLYLGPVEAHTACLAGWQSSSLVYTRPFSFRFGTEQLYLPLPDDLTAVSLGDWHYVAIVADADRVRIWSTLHCRDGEEISLLSADLPAPVPVGTGVFRLGAEASDFSLTAIPNPATSDFYGNLDECAFWNRALTQEEILAQYRAAIYGELPPSDKVELRWSVIKDMSGKEVLCVEWTSGVLETSRDLTDWVPFSTTPGIAVIPPLGKHTYFRVRN